MELWFILTLLAAVFGGLHVFAQKVGAMRGYNSSLVNSYSAGLSSMIVFVIAGLFEGFGELSLYMIAWALLGGVVYILGSNYRMDGLRHIDATVFLPLHKFFSPLFVLFLGIIFFKETMTAYEWGGIILGMTVPILLISRVESHRQKDMAKGLTLLILSAIFVAVASAIVKEATNLFSSVLLFAAINTSFGAMIGVFLYRFRKKNTETKEERHHFDKGLVILSIITSLIQVVSFSSLVLAFKYGAHLQLFIQFILYT